MKLSLVFELLLIFILLAFAASKSVRKNKISSKKHIQNRDSNGGDKIEENPINKYCKCVEAYCNCCKDFQLSVVALNGPGCATLKYLNGDKMSISLSFGKKVITNRTMSSRKPSPVCMPLPGGLSKFCGRVYNIARAGEEFRACLGLELQSKKTVEAAVRVSCFKFGPRGVTSEPADPLPLVPKDEKTDEEEEEDDDDYDDDAFGLVGDEDDDEEDDDDDDDDDGAFDAANVVDTSDYASFSLLGEDLLGDIFGSTSDKKKPKKNIKKQAPPSTKATTTTTTTTTTTRRPRPSRRPTRRPSTRTTTIRPIRTSTQRSTRTTTTRRTRTTTPRTTRSTTARITRSTTPRPSKPPRTKRPTRRPTRRPTKPPTTESTSDAVITKITTTTLSPTNSLPELTSSPQGLVQVSAAIETTEHMQTVNTISAHTSAPISANTENTIVSVIPVNTTPKTVTNFEDPGIEMSLATITGQLSAMQVTPMIANEDKESNLINTEEEDPKYEKVETLTAKTPSTVHVSAFLHDFETTEREPVYGDESRGHQYLIADSYFDNLSLPKKPRGNEFINMDDLDVLDLGKIGENLGDELGLFGKNKNKHKNKHKEHNENEKNDDYDDLVDAIGHTLMMRKSDKASKKSDRRRQNKMMRGDWAIQPVEE